jgi:hypothetical protein
MVRTSRDSRINGRSIPSTATITIGLAPTMPSPSRRRTVCCRNHGWLPWKDLEVSSQGCNWPRNDAVPGVRFAVGVSGTSWTPNLPQYVLLRWSFRLNLNLRRIPFLQFSDSQINSSFPFFLTSPQTRVSQVPEDHGADHRVGGCGSGLCTIVRLLMSPRTQRVHSDRPPRDADTTWEPVRSRTNPTHGAWSRAIAY